VSTTDKAKNLLHDAVGKVTELLAAQPEIEHSAARPA
jgi:hypothetical protein